MSYLVLQRAQGPIFDLKHCNARKWVEKNEVRSISIEMWLYVNLPFGRKLGIEQFGDRAFAVSKGCRQSIPLVFGRVYESFHSAVSILLPVYPAKAVSTIRMISAWAFRFSSELISCRGLRGDRSPEVLSKLRVRHLNRSKEVAEFMLILMEPRDFYLTRVRARRPRIQCVPFPRSRRFKRDFCRVLPRPIFPHDERGWYLPSFVLLCCGFRPLSWRNDLNFAFSTPSALERDVGRVSTTKRSPGPILPDR